MLRDRGTIKWTSLMLPEHVALLKEMWQEDSKIKRPEIDEQEIVVMNEKLCTACHYNEDIQLSIYKNGEITTIAGNIKRINMQSNTIQLISDHDDEGTITISFCNIIAINGSND